MTEKDESEILEDIDEMPKHKSKANSDEEDESVEKPKRGEKPPHTSARGALPAPKAPRTQKQIEAFQKVRDKKMENAKKRQDEKKVQEEEAKKELEAKIIKKAVSIKKKQIKKQVVLEEISDDETPIEVIKEMKKSLPKPVERPRPKFIFV